MNNFQNIAPARLEDWLRDYYFTTKIDLGSSGVQNFSFAELRELTGLGQEELDAVVFDDGRSLGTFGLRQAIADRWGDGDMGRVMVTHGSSEAILLVMQALLGAGDEVVVLDPGYYALTNIAESIGCVMKVWPLHFEAGFVPDLDELKGMLGPRTRMVVVNFPHNPTGASLTPEQQKGLIAAVEEVGAYLVWDRAFAELTYEGEPLPEPALLYERAISLGTLSKAYGLAGLRIGWCMAAPEVLARCVHLRDYTTVFLSPFVEGIAQRAVEHADLLVGKRLAQARANLRELTGWAARHEDLIDFIPPRGGVTVFPRFRKLDEVETLCEELGKEGILLVPGSCFGHPRHARLGFGGPSGPFREGLGRLSRCLNGLLASPPTRI
jgi:capreomycidine synthase